MDKNRKWHGIDCSNSVSLFEFDFLLRWVPKSREYELVHFCGFDDKGNKTYGFTFFNFEEWKGELVSEDWMELSKFAGVEIEEYKRIVTPVELVNDLWVTQGFDGVPFSSYVGMSESEVCKRLGRALAS